MVEHNPLCRVLIGPKCCCLTCAKDDGEKGDCCFRHRKACGAPCPDYEKEVEHGKT